MAVSGGYDVECLQDIPPSWECCICTLILRKPIQTSCGHRYCSNCLDAYFNQYGKNSKCPIDREIINHKKVFDDKALERDILSIKVKCSNHELKCHWTGELRNLETHVNDECLREQIFCENEDCFMLVYRSDLVHHMSSSCQYRSLVCIHCTEEYKYINQKVHCDSCPRFPVLCMNNCSDTKMPREEIQKHLSVCQLAVLPCSFANIGCSVQEQNESVKEQNKIIREQHRSIEEQKKITTQQKKSIEKQKQLILEQRSSIEELKEITMEQRRSIEELTQITMEQRSSIEELNEVTVEQRISIEELNGVTMEQRSSIEELNEVTMEQRIWIEKLKKITMEQWSSIDEVNEVTMEQKIWIEKLNKNTIWGAEPAGFQTSKDWAAEPMPSDDWGAPEPKTADWESKNISQFIADWAAPGTEDWS